MHLSHSNNTIEQYNYYLKPDLNKLIFASTYYLLSLQSFQSSWSPPWFMFPLWASELLGTLGNTLCSPDQDWIRVVLNWESHLLSKPALWEQRVCKPKCPSDSKKVELCAWSFYCSDLLLPPLLNHSRTCKHFLWQFTFSWSRDWNRACLCQLSPLNHRMLLVTLWVYFNLNYIFRAGIMFSDECMG